MGKNLVKLFHLLSIVLILLFFFNCQEPSTDQNSDNSSGDDYVESSVSLMNNLKGYWKNATFGDGFEIVGDILPQTFYQYNSADKADISFAGNIVGNEDDSKSEGFITIQITDPGTWGKTPGYFFVIRWENLTATTVRESSATKWPDDLAPGKSTKKEAETTYTIANGYFTYYGDYDKQ